MSLPAVQMLAMVFALSVMVSAAYSFLKMKCVLDGTTIDALDQCQAYVRSPDQHTPSSAHETAELLSIKLATFMPHRFGTWMLKVPSRD